jgi:ribokinase
VNKILVSGLINIETTLRVDAFPIGYSPVRYPFFGVNTTVSGVGFNIAKALTVLGDQVQFVSMVGEDYAGKLALAELNRANIPVSYILLRMRHTAQSVILFDGAGRRQINVDLKDIQDTMYPPDLFGQALVGCDLAVLCNINFSRPYLQVARQAGIRVATDVHNIADLDDPYNRDFMQAADILFMSDESLPVSPERWADRLLNHTQAEVIVIGLGGQGALLAVRREGILKRLPAVATRPVVNSIGAGDALFSSFLHTYLRTGNAEAALRKAMVFASYKIGEAGAADGFLDETGLDEWSRRV